jgi:hypothetical protein
LLLPVPVFVILSAITSMPKGFNNSRKSFKTIELTTKHKGFPGNGAMAIEVLS